MRPFLLLAALALAGCREPPDVPLTYLLDLQPRPGGPPIAGVGPELRPVTSMTRNLRLASVDDTVPLSGELLVPLTLRADVPAGALTIRAFCLVGDRMTEPPPVLVPGPLTALRLRFDPGDVGERVRVAVIGHLGVRPGARVEWLGPVVVPREPRLRIGLAFEEDRCGGHPATDFRIDVVGRRGARPVLRRRLDPRTSCGTWVDAEVSLREFAGQPVRLRLRTRAAARSERSESLHTLWSDPVLLGRRPAGPPPRNVILLSLDTLGARHLGAYGYLYATSPSLDAVAREGTLFERALSQYPSTAGSHMTLLTGLMPVRHGVRTVVDRVAEEVTLLPEHLRRAGYLTGAVTEDGVLSSELGFARGFHAYRENRARAGTPGASPATFAGALAWVREQAVEPFFLFAHTYEVHAPYEPRAPALAAVCPPGCSDDRARDVRRYDGEVRFLDAVVGLFVAELGRQGLLDRTLLVITADHGEAFGEHGAWRHGAALWEDVMHVPLVFRGPDVAVDRRVPTPVGLVDVLPTILDYAGAPAAPTVDGRSLRSALRGEPLAERPLFAEVRGTVGGRRGPDLRAVWIGSYKVVHEVGSDRWQVFYLPQDPGESRDLGPLAAPVLAEARQLLAGYERLDGRHGATAAEPLDPETVEKLRSLGYVE